MPGVGADKSVVAEKRESRITDRADGVPVVSVAGMLVGGVVAWRGEIVEGKSIRKLVVGLGEDWEDDAWRVVDRAPAEFVALFLG